MTKLCNITIVWVMEYFDNNRRVLPTLVEGGRPQLPLSHFYHHSQV